MKTIIMALLLAIAAPVHASDKWSKSGYISIDINGYSKHSHDTYVYQGILREYNSKNAGLGVNYGLNKYVEAFVGFYDNSYNKNTFYGGAKLKHDFVMGNVVVTPGISVGVSTGYEDTVVQADKYQFIAMPTVRVTYRGVGLTIGYVPAIKNDSPTYVPVSTITAQINIRVR